MLGAGLFKAFAAGALLGTLTMTSAQLLTSKPNGASERAATNAHAVRPANATERGLPRGARAR